MAIISAYSKIYEVNAGEHKKKLCVIRSDEDEEGNVQVVFNCGHGNNITIINRSLLEENATPGWKNSHSGYYSKYSLQEYLKREKGNGSNLIKEVGMAHPRTLIKGDKLATGEEVIDNIRSGYNSSILVNLSITGWIELPARIALALNENDNFELPINLMKGTKLATGCIIAKDSSDVGNNWVNIYLNKIDCCIKVPSCVPMALVWILDRYLLYRSL